MASQSLAELTWTSKPELDKEKALVSATRWMDTLDYVGYCCEKGQPLKWPRSGAVCGDYDYGCNDLPKQIEQCTFQLACILLGDPNFISGNNPGNDPDSGGGVPGQLIPGINNSDTTEISLGKGELAVKFKDDIADGESNVLTKVPSLSQVLGCLTTSVGTVSSSRLLYRVRS